MACKIIKLTALLYGCQSCFHILREEEKIFFFKSKRIRIFFFEARHPGCVSNKSNCKVYAYIVKQNSVSGGMLYTIRKAQLLFLKYCGNLKMANKGRNM